MPTYEEYAAQALARFPNVTEDQIREGYAVKYGKTPVRVAGPSFDEYEKRARAYYPAATDAQIKEAYDAKYGAPASEEITRGLKRSVGAPLLRFGGAMLGGLDRAFSFAPGEGTFDALGERLFNYGNEVQNENLPSREFQNQSWYEPEKLATNTLGALGQLGTMLATGPAGIAAYTVDDAGNMATELEAKGATRSEAQRMAIPYAIASSMLERTGLDRIVGHAPGRILTGAVEAGTEIAQNTLRDTLTNDVSLGNFAQSIGEQGVPSFIVGAMLGSSKGQRQAERAAAMANAQAMAEPERAPPAAEPAPAPMMALPPPSLGGFAVDSLGNAAPMTEADVQRGVDWTQAQRKTLDELGLGEARAIEQRMAEQRALQAQQETIAQQEAARVAAEQAALRAQQEALARQHEVLGPEDVGKPPKAEKVPVKVYAQPEGEVVTPWERAQAEDLAPVLDSMSIDRGWYMEGKGVTMSNPTLANGRREGRQFAHRNYWAPKAPWWDTRPAGTTEKKFDAVMKKLRAGKPITNEVERPIADWIVDMAEATVGRKDFGKLTYKPTAEDFTEYDSLNVEQDAVPVMNLARLLHHDPDYVDTIRKEIGDDREAFNAAVDRRLTEILGRPDGFPREEAQSPPRSGVIQQAAPEARSDAARGAEQTAEQVAQAPLGERLAGGSQRGSMSTRDIPKLDNLGRPLPEGQQSLPLPEGQAQQSAPGFGLQPPEGQAGRPAQQADMFGARPLGERIFGGRQRGSFSTRPIADPEEVAAAAAVRPEITPQEPGKVEIGGGEYMMNLLRGLTPEQFGMLKWALENLDSKVEAQRRGTRPWDATMQAAADKVRMQYGLTLETLVNLKPGATANAEQLAAYGTIVARATREVELAMRKFAETNSNEDLVAAIAAKERLAVMVTPFLAVKTEAGRALNILRANAKQYRTAADIIDAMGDGQRRRLEELAQQISRADTLDQVNGLIRTDYTPDWIDKLLEYRVSLGLLSGITTHQVNVLSNVGFNVLETAAQGLTVLAGKTPAAAFQARLAASIHGAALGLRNAKIAFQTEAPVLTAASQIDAPHMKAIGGKLGRVVRIPTRLLMAEDEVFKSVAYHQYLADRAMTDALKNKPDDARAEFERIMGTPELMSEYLKGAREYADRMTFQSKLGPVASGVAHSISHGPGRVGRLVIPFIRTPVNIFKEAIRFSPAAYSMKQVRDAVSKGGRDAAEAHARVAIGSSIMAATVMLAAQGLITGAGPDDDQDRALWLAEGRQPYSVKVNGKWVQYNRFDPMGTVMGIAADLYDIVGFVKDADLSAVGSALVTSIALNVGDKTFMKGIMDFSEAWSDPGRHMERYLYDMAGSFVPNVVAQTARWQDPYMRDARTFVDSMKARVPGMREELAARIGVKGDPIAENSATPLTMGAKVSTPQDDPLIDTMLRLGVSKGMPSRKIVVGKIPRELTEEDYSGMASFVQKARFNALSPLVQRPDFVKLRDVAPEAARAMLEQGWEEIGTKARMAYIFQNPDVLKRAGTKSAGKSLAARYQEQGR